VKVTNIHRGGSPEAILREVLEIVDKLDAVVVLTVERNPETGGRQYDYTASTIWHCDLCVLGYNFQCEIMNHGVGHEDESDSAS
jgi:hypothetical protein